MKHLALLSGVSYRTVCRLCYDSFHLGEATTIEKLAQALGVSTTQLSTLATITTEVRVPRGQKERHNS